MELSMSVAQKQVLSQNMIQSTEILQMSVLELESYIEQLAMENPIIEMPDDRSSCDPKEIDRQRKLDWLESTDLQNKVYYQADRSAENMEQNWHDARDSQESLSDYLSSQMVLNDFEAEELKVIYYLANSLDERGYFVDNTQDTAKFLGVSSDLVISMLYELQKLDPAGVGARNLKECLLLQLERKEDSSSLAKVIVRDYLEQIGKNHLHEISRKLHVSMDEIMDACEEIQKLNPKPGSHFSNREQLRYISPDAVVVKLEDSLDILINEYQYPKIHINSYYSELMQTTKDKEVKKYLHDKLSQANWVTSCIQQRTSTLSRVMNALTEYQMDFFLYGPGHKKPMRLSDLAYELDLHESTISRTLRSKYLQCSWGVFPLNYFLTSVAATAINSNEEMTPEQIKEMIQKIIAEENPSEPLSDLAISEKLKNYNVSISRRTVNKYRTQLNIPDKNGRKNW